MSRSKKMSSRSFARGIASRKRIADSWLSLSSWRMLSLVSNSMPRLSASSSRCSGPAEGANSSTFCSRPSSRTLKSAADRSDTSRPRASWAVTVRWTMSRPTRNTGGAAGSGPAASAGASARPHRPAVMEGFKGGLRRVLRV
jgi:hypothetical protein